MRLIAWIKHLYLIISLSGPYLFHHGIKKKTYVAPEGQLNIHQLAVSSS
jgi:hypothetical protein